MSRGIDALVRSVLTAMVVLAAMGLFGGPVQASRNPHGIVAGAVISQAFPDVDDHDDDHCPYHRKAPGPGCCTLAQSASAVITATSNSSGIRLVPAARAEYVLRPTPSADGIAVHPDAPPPRLAS